MLSTWSHSLETKLLHLFLQSPSTRPDYPWNRAGIRVLVEPRIPSSNNLKLKITNAMRRIVFSKWMILAFISLCLTFMMGRMYRNPLTRYLPRPWYCKESSMEAKESRNQMVINSRNLTILTYTNTGFLDFMDNWLISVTRLGIKDHITIVTRDSYAYAYTKKRWSTGLNIKIVNASFSRSEALPFGDPRFFNFVRFKPSLILNFLERGLDVLFTDLDMVWLENPLSYIPKGYDLHLMEEEHPELYEPQGDINICTGLIYFQSNNRTIALVREWKKKVLALPDVKTSDKVVFNNLLTSSKIAPQLKMNVLDFRKFVSGKYYFSSKWRERYSATKPAVVHNNYVIGLDEKVKRFKEVGLWFI